MVSDGINQYLYRLGGMHPGGRHLPTKGGPERSRRVVVPHSRSRTDPCRAGRNRFGGGDSILRLDDGRFIFGVPFTQPRWVRSSPGGQPRSGGFSHPRGVMTSPRGQPRSGGFSHPRGVVTLPGGQPRSDGFSQPRGVATSPGGQVVGPDGLSQPRGVMTSPGGQAGWTGTQPRLVRSSPGGHAPGELIPGGGGPGM